MKKVSLPIITAIVFLTLCLPTFSQAQLGGIDIKNNTSTPVKLVVSYTNSTVDDRVLAPKQTVSYPWISGKTLDHFTLQSVSQADEVYSTLYAKLFVNNEGVYAVGAVTAMTPFDSYATFHITQSGSPWVFGGQESLAFNVNPSDGYPYGSYSSSCQKKSLQGDSVTLYCNFPTFKNNGFIPAYYVILTGLNKITEGKQDSTIPKDMDITNYGKFENGTIAFTAYTSPVGRGANLPAGSYLQTCHMAYYNTKTLKLYAACANGRSEVDGEYSNNYNPYRVSFDNGRTWISYPPFNDSDIPRLTYNVSVLQLSKNGCSNIGNKNGVLVCS